MLVAIEAAASSAEQNSPQPSPTPTVRYIVSLAGAPEHLVRVKMILEPGTPERDLQLPVWNALYQVRDFAQYVTWVRAQSRNGNSLAVRKLDKSRWRISGSDGGAQGGAEVEYEILADLPGPFGVQLNAQHAFFNLAEILMYPVDARASPMRVQFMDIPPGRRIATALANSPAGDFSAENYDRLVDSPVEIGSFQESDFDEGGGHYRVVVDADPADHDMQQLVLMLRRLVSAAAAWMDDRPFETYLFLYHFPRGPAGNGMEHAYSTAIDLSAGRLADNLQALADLTAHEFFHLWDVKRIRPQSLEPVDYTKENYTRALWFSEGVDTAAGNIILLRAGLLDEPRYLKGLAAEIGELERRPAHRTQSAEESSLDAWLEKYEYYRLPSRSISYYNKGYLLGVLLDLQVREVSHGSASLRDLLEWMNRNYARQGKFFSDSDGVQQAAEAVSHTNLGWFFQKYVAGTDEIPWDDFFKTVGLHLVARTISVANVEFVASRNLNTTPVVAAITSGSAAQRAGLAPGDVILEVNGRPADADFEERLAELRPGEKLHLRVRNSDGEHELHWKLASREQVELDLADVDNVTVQQKARRAAWLKGESQISGEARP
ncbi:MAG: PDZ domain-containing protein [Terriglobales bacterium]